MTGLATGAMDDTISAGKTVGSVGSALCWIPPYVVPLVALLSVTQCTRSLANHIRVVCVVVERERGHIG